MTKICIAGATGFIGKNLIKRLKAMPDLEIVALSRKISPEMNGAHLGNLTWRRCNGFSLIDVEDATKDCDILIYLIHSMLPSTSLTQGSFSDFDLYMADNFSRAAKTNNIKKIIYLSGIIPPNTKLSEHLESRLEVEKVLAQQGNNLVALRAGLIIGKNGSSFSILEKLINRLPILICPAWTKTKCQPIDLDDVLASLEYVITNSEINNISYDIGGNDVFSYKEMLQTTARTLNKKRYFFSVPLFSPGLSKLWVSRITNTPSNLVYPLIDSLKHSMIVDNSKRLLIPNHTYKSFTESLKTGLSHNEESWSRSIINYNSKIYFRWLENVTSIQRITVNTKLNSNETAIDYFSWLGKIFAPFIKVNYKDDLIDITLLNRISMIKLQKSSTRSSQDRSVYYIISGLLASKTTLNGRLEFRKIDQRNCTLVALLDFRPSLP